MDHRPVDQYRWRHGHRALTGPRRKRPANFLKDKLGLPFVDGGGGWMIFGIPMAEAAVHPADETRHEISFWCDDIETTVAELRDRGVAFKSPIEEEPWGRIITMEMPGGVDILLFEPKHPQPSV